MLDKDQKIFENYLNRMILIMQYKKYKMNGKWKNKKHSILQKMKMIK